MLFLFRHHEPRRPRPARRARRNRRRSFAPSRNSTSGSITSSHLTPAIRRRGFFLGYAIGMAVQALWCSVIGFLAGVFARSFFFFGWASVTCCFLLGAFVFVYGLLFGRSRAVALAGILLVSFGVGGVRMHVSTLSGSPEIAAFLNGSVTVEGVVSAEPDVRESSVRLFVRAKSLHVKDTQYSFEEGVLAVLPAHTEVSFGDSLLLQGVLRAPESFDTGLGRVFNYPAYLAKDGILYELASAQILERHHARGFIYAVSPMPLALKVKDAYMNGLRMVLPEPHASLAAGITVGDKRGIGKELSETFRAAGLTHILVLSGYNITIVIEAIQRLLAPLVPLWRVLGVFGGVIFLVLVSGMQSSALRAGAMALVAVYARGSGRIFAAARVLFVVCAGMVLWNPFILAFDPGFQLSALATLGLVLGVPLLETRLSWVPARFGFREIVSGTCSAQIAVLPLLLYQNGMLPMYALFANIATLAAIPFAMAASCVAAVFGMVFGTLGAAFALPAYALLSYVIGMARVWVSLPYAAVSIPAFSAVLLFCTYLLLGYVVWRGHDARSQH